MKEYHVLNLGAGVQSTMLYVLAVQKHEVMPPLDYAIFADTGEEPVAVYAHLKWLQSLDGPEILIRSAGSRLGDDLKYGTSPSGTRILKARGDMPARRFASIPTFTAGGGIGRRQCTMDYKVAVIERTIRRDIVGLKPRQRFPVDDVHVHQYLGLSFDEAKRVLRVRKRFYETPWATPHFPLFETNTTRAGAIAWLEKRVPHTVPRSACVFCPYHSNEEWQALHRDDPSNPDWRRAVEIDETLRDDTAVCSRGMREMQYLHRSCVPLKEADISTPEPHAEFAFVRECEGMCGV